jgi:chromosome segregation ATPase
MPEPSVDESNVIEGVQPQGAAATATPEKKEDHPGLAHLSDEDRNAILDLRKESAEKRVKYKEAVKELEDLKADIQKQKEAKLREDGRLQELLSAKEAEIEEIKMYKEKAERYEQHITEQLEAAMSALTETQKEFINDSNMEIEKKLKWALKLKDEGAAPVAPPDSVRPGGKAPSEKINMDDYRGPEGIKRLVGLKNTNPTLFQTIINTKNKT